MISKEITFNNFDGEEETTTYYFDLSAMDVARLTDGKLEEYTKDLNTIFESGDFNAAISVVAELLTLACGVKRKVGDRMRFLKLPAEQETFRYGGPLDALLLEFVGDPEYFTTFLQDLIASANAPKTSDKPQV